MVYTGVADSITSEDSTTWTVILEDGWTFHDGTPVTAQSFVDAWNYTAYSPNAQAASHFSANVAGYEDLQAPTDDAGELIGEPAAMEMSGLAVVDDLTFTVTLGAPFAQWPVTVGYSAFYPLPESFFEDPEAAGEQPVGNGPFQADEPFQPGVGITLTRYDEYAGEDKAEVSAVEYRVYTDVKTAYTDVVAGNLDVLRRIPARRVRRALPGGHLVLLHLPGASALRQALRRQAGPSGAVDGNRPRGDRHCDLQRHPDSGHIGHRPR